MQTIKPPKLDGRRRSDLLDLLKRRVPHYTPEWPASDEKDPGVALLKIFSGIAETVIHRFNQVPGRNFIAFLDMLGIKLLPAQPSRVPLTFTLAEGTDKELLVPARSQAATAKTEAHEALPFETETNLLAVPSRLKTVVSIDPAADAIYLPPPGFLDAKRTTETRWSYKTVSSAPAGSRILQLDHITDLKEGDFLKIGETGTAEYAVVAGIAGTLVTVTDTLLHPFAVDTTVEKLADFTLFEGKNMQEHSLYIGHGEFFNVESTAKFTLSLNHSGVQAGVSPLEVSWEYWGEIAGEEGEGWRKFRAVDLTGGLSASGDVELVKPLEGEIKEKEVNGVKSRWIRCRVEEPLPSVVPRKLPLLDEVRFRVSSSGSNLLPDQAFYNEISLDLSKPFSPFGNEPRIFDRFAVATKEAFSKKGAKISLDFEIDPRIGAPAAIFEKPTGCRVFARGAGGRLMELQPSISPARWEDYGVPPGTALAHGSRPYINAYSSTVLGVFARAENGHLVECMISGDMSRWFDHGVPNEGVVAAFDPFAIHREKSSEPLPGTMMLTALASVSELLPVSVCVTGSDGHLHEFDRIAGSWKDHGKTAEGHRVDSSPYAVKSHGRAKVFVKGEEGRLWALDFDEGWHCYGAPPSSAVASRPFAGLSEDGSHARAYVKGSDGRLWEYDTGGGWSDRGVRIDSEPHGYIEYFEPGGGTSDSIDIFGRDIEGNLVRWYTEGGASGSETYQRPSHSRLFFSPFVLERAYLFSAGSNNTMIERELRSNTWNEYKDPNETSLTPSLSWEYWNRKGWVVIKGLEDGTANLLRSGSITFDLPDDIEASEVAGQESYWIRARIVAGDYGRESFTLAQESSFHGVTKAGTQLIAAKNTIRPPIVRSLAVSYELSAKKTPEALLSLNNLSFVDQTEASKTPGMHFAPFSRLEEDARSLYLGFERFFTGGPVRIFLAAGELPFSEAMKPKLQWRYSREIAWNELSFLDATEALIKAEILDLAAPSDFAARSLFGAYRYWIKGSLVKGAYEQSPRLEGIYPNTTWAVQAESIRDEILGSGDGRAGQTFSFFKSPVLEGENVRVRELLSEEEKTALLESLGEEAIHEVRDEKGAVTENWVLWREVPDFFDSAPQSRHYTLDRATGTLRFGNGTRGMVPPAGDDNIMAFSYQSGGGAEGNVTPGEVKTLKSSVGGLDKVLNPVAADGGADTATVDEMLEVGPAMISHRNRAVTAEDFEWLAKQASRKVARARCLPHTNNQNASEAGWVTVVILPDSPEARPYPSLELKRRVRDYLEAHCAATLAHRQHLHVEGPSYAEIGVLADVFAISIDTATEAERRVKAALEAFFHPLTGGPEGEGWEFGRHVTASDICALLEPIEGVDHVENVRFSRDGVIRGEIVEVERNVLVAGGTHEITIEIRKGG